jgi:hypothetical protein
MTKTTCEDTMTKTTLNPTMTLKDIRARGPRRVKRGQKTGWNLLVASLGPAGRDRATRVSLGDVARSNGAADAWWCVCALDWTDIAVRRAVVAPLLKAVRRAATHTADRRVHDCIDAVQRWCDGDGAVDLIEAAREAEASASAREAEAEAWAAWAAASSREAGAAAGAEIAQQRQDLIAAFPPHQIKG